NGACCGPCCTAASASRGRRNCWLLLANASRHKELPSVTVNHGLTEGQNRAGTANSAAASAPVAISARWECLATQRVLAPTANPVAAAVQSPAQHRERGPLKSSLLLRPAEAAASDSTESEIPGAPKRS